MKTAHNMRPKRELKEQQHKDIQKNSISFFFVLRSIMWLFKTQQKSCYNIMLQRQMFRNEKFHMSAYPFQYYGKHKEKKEYVYQKCALFDTCFTVLRFFFTSHGRKWRLQKLLFCFSRRVFQTPLRRFIILVSK